MLEEQNKAEMIARNAEEMALNKEQREKDAIRANEITAAKMEKARVKAAKAEERRAKERAEMEENAMRERAEREEADRVRELSEAEEKAKMKAMAKAFMEETARKARDQVEAKDKGDLARETVALDREIVRENTARRRLSTDKSPAPDPEFIADTTNDADHVSENDYVDDDWEEVNDFFGAGNADAETVDSDVEE